VGIKSARTCKKWREKSELPSRIMAKKEARNQGHLMGVRNSQKTERRNSSYLSLFLSD
jgi:hypothetical protein